jgi:hypothetical protein
VKRVEWIDNPGLRYNGANAVLNFIVVNPTAGGSLMVNAMPALNTAWGKYYGDLKLNRGRSQWSVGGHYKLINRVAAHREYEEMFTYENGDKLTRKESPKGGYMNGTFANMEAGYSYIKPDTTVLNIEISGRKSFNGGRDYEGMMTMSNAAKNIYLHESNDENGFAPSINAYLEQHFAHNQIIALNLDASLYNGNTHSEYREREEGETDYLTDVYTAIKDNNRSYAATADYIKRWKGSRLTAGVNYAARRNRSTYHNLNDAVYHQNMDKVYMFAEYMQRLKKLTLTAGMGAQYTTLSFEESGRKSDSWSPRPRLSATYKLDNASQFRINFTSWQNAPTLAQTNEAPQQIDGFQWQIGNQELKTYSTYRVTLRYDYTSKRINGTFGINGYTSPNLIAPYYEWQGEKLVRSYENSKNHKSMMIFLSPEIEVIPDWLTVSGTIQYLAEHNVGTGYSLYNHNWSGDVSAELTYKNYGLLFQYQKAQKALQGETLSWGESMSIVGASYNKNRFSAMLLVICPFTKYDMGSKLLNRYNTNSKHVRLDMAPMPVLQLTYNLQWGHQKRNASRLVESNSSVDKSSVGGR